MSKDKKRRKKMINSTTMELPKKAVALHALPRPRDRYRGIRATIPRTRNDISQMRGKPSAKSTVQMLLTMVGRKQAASRSTL
jgi:hypothetical protein